MHPEEPPAAAAELPAPDPLPPDRARAFYRDMLAARLLDEEAIALQRQGVLPAYVPVRGQEAAQVGSVAALDVERDFVFPTYRELAAALALGVDMVGYLASHRALWHGGRYDPMASRFGAVNAVVGGPVPHAVGWAMGERLAGRTGCALSFFGDGASSEGDVHEAMNLAGVMRAPVVFLCQNNRWALSVPNERQIAGGSIAARAAGYGMPGAAVDGNDVAAVYQATREAVRRARSGLGPSLIEARTYRMGPHSTSDDTGRYRDPAEERAWEEHDPIARLRDTMRAAGHADDEFFARAERAARASAERARDGVCAEPEPPGDDLFRYVYREPTEELARQWRAWREEVAP
ncbi:pyruvate dehydrogenase E1 component alpha subunit [Lipingzhangella halophila]|uniref:2-oxoisovalerate dehydrogenase subunit alpha n=1 Tax=Lipingzhangella halophila TaxID=1783352 RepID=A0A7W7W1D6_9ACTN|nr:thiamine pyrophosphate-dependent enzyme [Lipingzhangella halophila]MBB4930208.1 pyruvate dehydrogenase E1 component alpha subunit [Lipingzhangella halophila]